MAPLLNAKGQSVKISFFDLFGPNKPSRSGEACSLLQRGKPKKEEESTETSPTSTAATEAPSESTKTTEAASSKWTRLEELALLGMKAQRMSWKETNEALPGKSLEDIKKKYQKLYADAPAASKPWEAQAKKEEMKKETEKNKEEKKDERKDEVKGDEAKAAEESKKKSGNDKKDGKEGKQGKKGQKGHKGQKGKVTAEEAKPEEVKVEGIKAEEKIGSLKARATAGESGKGGELKSINGHPVIFVDDDEELDFEELLYLYGLSARYDEQKWMTVDSKFFDKFGKRIGGEKLKEKLAGTW